MSVILYGFWRSIATFRVRVALRLKGLMFDEIPIDILSGEQFKPDYETVNAEAVVPTLVHDGHSFFQSLAIIEYLDDIQPDPRLLPAEFEERAFAQPGSQRLSSGGAPGRALFRHPGFRYVTSFRAAGVQSGKCTLARPRYRARAPSRHCRRRSAPELPRPFPVRPPHGQSDCIRPCQKANRFPSRYGQGRRHRSGTRAGDRRR